MALWPPGLNRQAGKGNLKLAAAAGEFQASVNCLEARQVLRMPTNWLEKFWIPAKAGMTGPASRHPRDCFLDPVRNDSEFDSP